MISQLTCINDDCGHRCAFTAFHIIFVVSVTHHLFLFAHFYYFNNNNNNNNNNDNDDDDDDDDDDDKDEDDDDDDDIYTGYHTGYYTMVSIDEWG